MKKNFAKLLSLAFALLTVMTAVFMARVELHGAEGHMVYCNDRPWYSESRLPAENVYGAVYLPLDLFVQLPTVNVRVNDTLNTFIITHGDKYLSFDVNSNFAANQDRVRMYIATAEYHGERYVPAKTVCTYLGLRYEEMVSTATGAVAVRVSDERSAKTFYELVKKHYPEFFEPKETPPVSETKDTTEAPVLSERTLYIAIDLSEGTYADDILQVLSKYNCIATFFLRDESLESSPELLSKIAAAGHELAIGADGSAWDSFGTAEDIVKYIEEKNSFLERAVRRKSHMIGLPHNGGLVMKEDAVTSLNGEGYFGWYSNVTVPSDATVYRGSNIAINGIWRNDVAGIWFAEGRNTKDTLERVLKFIDSNRSACELRLITPPFNGYGDGQ